MYWTSSQILIVMGLILEFLSVLIISYQAFYPLSKKERKMKYIEDTGQSIDSKLERRKWMGILTIGLLSAGIFLQGLAIFI